MRSGKRLGAALLGATVTLMLSALPAGADEVTATLDKVRNVDGLGVQLKGGDKFSTHLFGLNADGVKLSAYCINIEDRVHYDQGMVEKPWDSYPDASSSFGKNHTKIYWLLHNSFPFVGTEALGKRLALKDLSKEESIAATQAAAWHFSDDKDLDREHPTPDAPDSKADVLALYDYLTGAKNVGLENLPAPKLELTPKSLDGMAGKRIGPFTVATTASIVKLAPKLPAGVKLTDKDGKELTAGGIANGSELFLDVPAGTAAGEGSFELSATSEAGRVFVAKTAGATQNMIVAQAEAAKLSVAGQASWTAAAATPETPAPQASNGGLANTGVSIYVPIAIGALLLLAGAGALLYLRRRGRA